MGHWCAELGEPGTNWKPDFDGVGFWRRMRGRWSGLIHPGLVGCLRCGIVHNHDWTKDHATNYTANSGVHVLCERCWVELGTPEARWYYYDRIVDNWITSEPVSWKNDPKLHQDYEAKRQLIHDAVMAGK